MSYLRKPLGEEAMTVDFYENGTFIFVIEPNADALSQSLAQAGFTCTRRTYKIVLPFVQNVKI